MRRPRACSATSTCRARSRGRGPPRPERGTYAGQTLAEQLLWGGACGGSPQIVEMSLAQVDSPRQRPAVVQDASRAPAKLERRRAAAGRVDYLECFRLILARTHANVIGSFGRSVLHAAIGSNAQTEAEARRVCRRPSRRGPERTFAMKSCVRRHSAGRAGGDMSIWFGCCSIVARPHASPTPTNGPRRSRGRDGWTCTDRTPA